MSTNDILQEAQRLINLHSASADQFAKAGLAPDWSAKLQEAIKGPSDCLAQTALPLMGQFVRLAAKIYSPADAVKNGVDIPGEAPSGDSPKPCGKGTNGTPEEILQGMSRNILYDVTGATDTHSAQVFSNESIVMGDDGRPTEIAGFDALDNTTTKIDCRGIASVSCDPWKTVSYTEVTAADVSDISFEEQVDKDKDSFSVKVRLWKLTKHSEKQHYKTYKYRVCCCRWAWGAFRFPGDCRSMYQLLKEGDMDVPKGTIQRDLIFEKTYYDWTDEILKILKNALKSAADKAGSAVGGDASKLVDPIAEKASNEIKSALGLPQTSGTGAGGSGSSGSGSSSGGAPGTPPK